MGATPLHLDVLVTFSKLFFYQILTKDSVTCAVDAIIIARISEATMSIINIEDAHASVRLLAATTLRNILGTKTLGEILSQREQISHSMQVQTFHFSKNHACFNSYLLLSCQAKSESEVMFCLQIRQRLKIDRSLVH